MKDMEGNLRTTAMGILPHTDIDAALELALSLDIPFWPQLPKVSFYEDMYAQMSEGFPGVRLDLEGERILFDTARFYEELPLYAEASSEPGYFALRSPYSAVYERFLACDLERYSAIRGQVIGPISFGLKVVDENLKPIIYNSDIKIVLFEFMLHKTNYQVRQLQARNPNAFVWLDDPGLELLFTSFTGYVDFVARQDLAEFLAGFEGPKGVHLCGNPDWDFLLSADLDLLSFDAYGRGEIFTRYAEQVMQFIEQGRTISWGAVPTKVEDLNGETLDSLIGRLEALWGYLAQRGMDREQLLRQSLLAPATCCLVNPDRTETVERAFGLLREMSHALRWKYGLV
jgi:hypothetical protein